VDNVLYFGNNLDQTISQRSYDFVLDTKVTDSTPSRGNHNIIILPGQRIHREANVLLHDRNPWHHLRPSTFQRYVSARYFKTLIDRRWAVPDILAWRSSALSNKKHF